MFSGGDSRNAEIVLDEFDLCIAETDCLANPDCKTYNRPAKDFYTQTSFLWSAQSVWSCLSRFVQQRNRIESQSKTKSLVQNLRSFWKLKSLHLQLQPKRFSIPLCRCGHCYFYNVFGSINSIFWNRLKSFVLKVSNFVIWWTFIAATIRASWTCLPVTESSKTRLSPFTKGSLRFRARQVLRDSKAEHFDKGFLRHF